MQETVVGSWVRPAVWILACLMSNASIQPARAQVQFFGNQASQEDVFMLAPRPLVRLLREGEKAVQEERYADAILTLGAILDDDNPGLPEDLRGQDFFLGPAVRGRYTKTVRSEARRLLGNLGEDAREILEIEYGIPARKALDAAIQGRDLREVAKVARRYSHTIAGYDARLLVARQKLSEGLPLAAASMLNSLVALPVARERYGPELSRLTAICWMLADREIAAVQVLVEAGNYYPGQSIVLAGKRMELGVEADWLARLNLHVEESQVGASAQRTDNWTVSGGNSARNAVAQTSLPLPSARWDARIHSSLPEKDALLNLASSEQQANRVLLPKFEARMLGDLVLTKTTDSEVLAIDLETGLTRWPFYRNSVPTKLMQFHVDNRGGRSSGPSTQLKNRVWGSSAYGRFSCDTERLYYVTEARSRAQRDRRTGYLSWNPTNQLQAASIASEGKILWVQGGSAGSDDELSNCYFLGPPLMHEGELYSIVEINGEIRLVVMNPESGDVLWHQHLCSPSAGMSAAARTHQALSPTISEGLVLCPTGAGAVVAVDLVSRNLTWGTTYHVSIRRSPSGALDSGSFNPLAPRWHDPGMIVQDGLLVVSPVETPNYFVLNVLTGEVIARQSRSTGRYIAGVRDNKVYVVSDRNLACFDVRKNVIAWRKDFPDRALLAGKGLWLEDRVMLPLTGNRLVEFSLEFGDPLGEVRLDRPVGNLFSHRGDLISLTGTELSVFYTQVDVQNRVEQRLAEDADDVWALNQKSQLLASAGDTEKAFSLLTKSIQVDPSNADTQHFLVQTILNGLETNYEEYKGVAEEFRDIVEDSPQRPRFLRWLARGSLNSGNYLDAFENLLGIMREKMDSSSSMSSSIGPPIDLSQAHSVSEPEWIATELSRIYEKAEPADRMTMDGTVESELSSIQDLVLSQQLLKLRYFAWHPAAGDALIRCAILLGQREQYVASEKLLMPLLYSDREETRLVAEKLLNIQTMADKLWLGPRGQLFDPVDDPNSLNVREMLEQSETPEELMEPIEWNRGMVDVELMPNPGYYIQGVRLPQVAERFGRPGFDLRLSAGVLIVSNSNGEVVSRLSYGRGSSDDQSSFNRAIVLGGLLIVETSSEVVGFDLYQGLENQRDALLWRYSLRAPAPANPLTQVIQADRFEIQNNLGLNLGVRKMQGEVSQVGPLTPGGLILQLGDVLTCINPYTGRKVWEKKGYTGILRFVRQDLKLAVIQKSLGKIDVLDCRDGAVLDLRKIPEPDCSDPALREEVTQVWSTVCASGELVFDFLSVTSNDPTVLINKLTTNDSLIHIWNAMTGETLVCMRVPRGTRANILEERYAVLLDPNGWLHMVDMEQQSYHKWEVEKIQQRISKIRLMRFQDRMVVLTANGSDIRNRTEDQYVFSVDLSEKDLEWTLPGRLRSLYVPDEQPRNSPFLLAYRRLSDGATDEKLALALIDMRDGSLAYSNLAVNAKPNGMAIMRLVPRKQEIDLVIGDKYFNFRVGRKERPPQPVFDFGLAP